MVHLLTVTPTCYIVCMAKNNRNPAIARQVADSRAIAWDAKVDAMREGRYQRSVKMDPNRRADRRRKAARGRSVRDY